MGKEPLRLTSGSGIESFFPSSLFHLSHVPLSFPSVDPPENISGPPELLLLNIFFRLRGLPFILLLLNISRRNSDMSAGTEPRRGDGMPGPMLSTILVIPLLLLLPVLLLLLLLFIGRFSRSSRNMQLAVTNFKQKLVIHNINMQYVYVLVKDKILPRRFPRAVSCGRLALRGAATLPSRGPKANLLKPPPENGISISVILIIAFFLLQML